MKRHNHTRPGYKRLELRRLGASIRSEERAARSNEEQLALIEQRPGNSTRERARLTGEPRTRRGRTKRQRAQA